MARGTIKLAIDGDVSLGDLRIAVNAFVALVDALAEEVAPESDLRWDVAELHSGSAVLVCRAEVETSEEEEVATYVARRYAEVGESTRLGDLSEFNPGVRRSIRELTGLLNGRIPSIRLGDDSHQWVIERPLVEMEAAALVAPKKLAAYTKTSVRGQIDLISHKAGRLYFTLRQAHTGQDIRCFPDKKFKKAISEYWESEQWVLVAGLLGRESRPPTLTDITVIESLGEAGPGEWRSAVGSAPPPPGTEGQGSASTIRKFRDAEP